MVCLLRGRMSLSRSEFLDSGRLRLIFGNEPGLLFCFCSVSYRRFSSCLILVSFCFTIPACFLNFSFFFLLSRVDCSSLSFSRSNFSSSRCAFSATHCCNFLCFSSSFCFSFSELDRLLTFVSLLFTFHLPGSLSFRPRTRNIAFDLIPPSGTVGFPQFMPRNAVSCNLLCATSFLPLVPLLGECSISAPRDSLIAFIYRLKWVWNSSSSISNLKKRVAHVRTLDRV
mmetsp:Transcript_4449/g.6652  ORF Transcript_4449/g.6652 Transcript_4449/m.6652 type:complete len:227 (+) Transcript_4449:720-1400(+)